MGFLDSARKRLPFLQKGSSHENEEEYATQQEDNLGEEPEEASYKTPKSVFSVDDSDKDNAVNTLNRRYRQTNSSNASVLKARDGKVQDVLDVMRIPSTFDLEPFVLLPEDLDEIDFSIMVPKGYGYDQSEVDAVFARVKETISEYLRLLKLRNEHIAQLASTVDRLQVDAYNARYDAEIANGINIMPTESMVDMENELMELRLLVKKLEEENSHLQKGYSAEGYEQIVDENLSDQVSLLSRENDDLREEIIFLKEKLSTLQDDQMDTAYTPEGVHPDPSSLPELGDPGRQSILESNAAFDKPDESLEDFLDSQDYYTSGTGQEYEDEDNSALEEFFKN